MLGKINTKKNIPHPKDIGIDEQTYLWYAIDDDGSGGDFSITYW